MHFGREQLPLIPVVLWWYSILPIVSESSAGFQSIGHTSGRSSRPTCTLLHIKKLTYSADRLYCNPHQRNNSKKPRTGKTLDGSGNTRTRRISTITICNGTRIRRHVRVSEIFSSGILLADYRVPTDKNANLYHYCVGDGMDDISCKSPSFLFLYNRVHFGRE